MGVIREPSAAERTRALSEIRDRLRFFEASELAEVAAYLAESTERLLRFSESLHKPLSEDWYTLERAAVEMGFVDDEGRPQKHAFSRQAKALGVPRADLSQTRIYYHREDLDKMLHKLRR